MSEHESVRLRRREFLALACVPMLPATAFAASPSSAPGAGRATVTAAGVTTTCEPFVSMGYWAGSDAYPPVERVAFRQVEGVEQLAITLREAPPREVTVDPVVVGAHRLSHGDPTLANGQARMTVHGCFAAGDLLADETLDSLSLSVDLGHCDPRRFGGVHWPVWCLSRRPLPNVSAPVTFAPPLSGHADMTLHVERRGDVAAGDRDAGVRRTSIRLSLGAEPGVPKMRRGLYVVGLEGGGHRHAPWAHLRRPADAPRADGEDRREIRVQRTHPLAASPRLPFLVVSVDGGAVPLAAEASLT